MGPLVDMDALGVPGMIETDYKQQLSLLQQQLALAQRDIQALGRRVLIIFEGRDAAGKGGMIKRIAEPLNPRGARIVALPKPSDVETGQWYFQRYLQHLPAAGEIVLFDRSWYNRACVEPVMGFCSSDQYRHFIQTVPALEKLLVEDGIQIIKFWITISAEEQERRLRARSENPAKRWKLSPVDIEARSRWSVYSDHIERMFDHTDRNWAPWHVVGSDDKKLARLSCMDFLLHILGPSLAAPDAKLPTLPTVQGGLPLDCERERMIPLFNGAQAR